jgi:hypothetical protein
MSQGAEPSAYLVDAETFSALKRVARRLHADDPLAGEERRSLANRMGALLHKVQQPEQRGPEEPKSSFGHCDSFSLLKKGCRPLRASA